MVACQQMGERSWVSVAKPDFKNMKLQRSLASAYFIRIKSHGLAQWTRRRGKDLVGNAAA